MLLTAPAYRDYDIHIHHVHNKNVEKRWRAEKIAVASAINELTRMGFRFQYSDSEIGTQVYGRQFMYDTDSMNFFAGYVCSVNPNIKKVAMGMQANDANQQLEERRIRAGKIFSAFTDAEKIFPVLDMTKREIYDSLPYQLKDKFWSCRRPVYTEKSIAPCKKCDTCIKLYEQSILCVNLKDKKRAE
jgi:hypothetical protein